MKTLGIIGGIGPESTVDYYKLLISLYRERRPNSYPPIIINSIDLDHALTFLNGGNLKGLTDYFAPEIEKLARAGADFALLAANTPHIIFEELAARSPLPLLSIVSATSDAARVLALKRPALIATRFTMQAHFYQDTFAHVGLSIVTPNPAEQDYIHDKYFSELVKGVFLPETRSRLLAILDRMKSADHIDGVILGGTELPLILRAESHNGLPLLDTTQIHVRAAIEEMLR